MLFGLVVVRMAGPDAPPGALDGARARAGAGRRGAGRGGHARGAARPVRRSPAAGELAGDDARRSSCATPTRFTSVDRLALSRARQPWSSTWRRARAAASVLIPLSGPSGLPSAAVREILRARWARRRSSLAFERAGADRGAGAAPERGALRVAGAALVRPDHRARRPTRRSSTSRPRSSACSGGTPEEVVGPRIDDLMRAGEGSRLLQLIADGAAPPVASQTLECALSPQGRHHAPVRGPVHQSARTTSTSAASCSTRAT